MSKELIERLLDNRVTGFNLTVAAVEAADLIEAQAAQIDVMRDALKEVQMVAESSVKTHGYDKHHVRNSNVAKRALATTHNEALQAFAEKVRDQCALVIEAQDVDPSFKHRMADAIRARGDTK